MNKILTPKVRVYLYGVAIAFVPLAVYLGWLAPEATPIVLPLILAIFNVPLKAPQEAPQDGSVG